ncbi:hypothetical protein [Pseudarthrobacter sp. NamB4]|nr:hypothetical protein [Pseudarthrobacter sp. NamB4]
MESLAGAAAVMEAVHTSVTRLDALFLEDARLDAGGPATSGAAGYAAVD